MDITKNDPPNQGGPERAKVEMQDKSSAPVVNDTESDLRMQNISEFSGEANDIVSDNQTAPVGAIGLGMAASRIDVNSSLNKSRDPYPRKGDIFSYEARSDEMVNSDNESGRHNINALKLEEIGRSRHELHDRRLVIAPDGHSRVAQPGNTVCKTS